LVGIKKILSLSDGAPIEEAVNLGLIYEFIRLLDHQLSEFIFEAVWCMTNIASGTSEQIKSIISKGGIEKLILLIDHPVAEIQDQAIMAIGNIASDSVKTRDRIVDFGGLDKIIKKLATTERDNLTKQCIWAISSFTRSKPALAYEVLQPCIDHVIGSIYKVKEQNNDFLIEVFWVLNAFIELYKRFIKTLIDSVCLPKLLTYLE
jgi:importin subunit alpha-1